MLSYTHPANYPRKKPNSSSALPQLVAQFKPMAQTKKITLTFTLEQMDRFLENYACKTALKDAKEELLGFQASEKTGKSSSPDLKEHVPSNIAAKYKKMEADEVDALAKKNMEIWLVHSGSQDFDDVVGIIIIEAIFFEKKEAKKYAEEIMNRYGAGRWKRKIVSKGETVWYWYTKIKGKTKRTDQFVSIRVFRFNKLFKRLTPPRSKDRIKP